MAFQLKILFSLFKKIHVKLSPVDVRLSSIDLLCQRLRDVHCLSVRSIGFLSIMWMALKSRVFATPPPPKGQPTGSCILLVSWFTDEQMGQKMHYKFFWNELGERVRAEEEVTHTPFTEQCVRPPSLCHSNKMLNRLWPINHSFFFSSDQ